MKNVRMNTDTNERINASLVHASLHGMGIGPAPDLEQLRRCSLAEMVAARDAIAAANAAATAGGHPFTLTSVCADRLIAAIYTALHYDATDADEPEPILLLADHHRSTVLVHVIAPAVTSDTLTSNA